MVKLIEEKKTGKDVFKCYELGRGNGVRAQIINYGGRIHRLFISDINGVERDVVIGFNDISEYKGSGGYFNALIGRVGNRIGGAAFELNGKNIVLGQTITAILCTAAKSVSIPFSGIRISTEKNWYCAILRPIWRKAFPENSTWKCAIP